MKKTGCVVAVPLVSPNSSSNDPTKKSNVENATVVTGLLALT